MTERLSPGDTAPDFDLPTDGDASVHLADLRGKKVIVYFYPSAMTPGCTKQACDFTESLTTLEAAGYTVVGISPDKPEKLAKFRERDSLTITLASDADKAVMTSYGAYGEKKLYGKVVQGVIRSTIVVDEEALDLADLALGDRLRAGAVGELVDRVRQPLTRQLDVALDRAEVPVCHTHSSTPWDRSAVLCRGTLPCRS